MLILLVEDDELLANAMANALRSQGWHVDVSSRGEPIARSVQRDPYDALVLDIGLPGIDGLETLRRVREQGSMLPVLIVTARDAVEDRVLGLEAGADDYLIKPFAVSELGARLRALPRRRQHREAGTLTLATLRFDAVGQRAYVGSDPLRLSARECIVLEHLLLNVDRVVRRQQLVALVPGWAAGVSENALEILISRLRGKIEPAGVTLRTVRGLGYFLEAAAPK
jgi:DNA-binding response OmpR family regulator